MSKWVHPMDDSGSGFEDAFVYMRLEQKYHRLACIIICVLSVFVF